MVPSLLASDMQRTIEFFSNLGFRLDDAYPNASAPTWIALTRDGVTLMFYSEPPHGTPQLPTCSGTFYLYPENLDTLIDDYQRIVRFVWGPAVMPYGKREFAIKDPNGYYFAFVESR